MLLADYRDDFVESFVSVLDVVAHYAKRAFPIASWYAGAGCHQDCGEYDNKAGCQRWHRITSLRDCR